MSINDPVKWFRAIRASLRGLETEPAQAMLEYVLVLTLFAITAIGTITVLGCDVSVSSSPIATHVFSAG